MKKLQLLLLAGLFGSGIFAQNPPTPASPSAPVLSSSGSGLVVASNDYKISPGDQVQFGVLGEPETNNVGRVSQEGKIILPYLGNIEVAGLSVAEAREKITSLYKPDYYIDPQINLIVTNPNVKIVSFMGTGINRPGPVEIPSDRDLYLLEAIGKAAGFSRVGSWNVEVRRQGPDKKLQILKFNAKKIGPKDGKLEPDDVIVVEEFGILGANN